MIEQFISVNIDQAIRNWRWLGQSKLLNILTRYMYTSTNACVIVFPWFNENDKISCIRQHTSWHNIHVHMYIKAYIVLRMAYTHEWWLTSRVVSEKPKKIEDMYMYNVNGT